jgi:hypothetical protein
VRGNVGRMGGGSSNVRGRMGGGSSNVRGRMGARGRSLRVVRRRPLPMLGGQQL